MNKMVIKKKDVATYSSLITDTLVVNGILKVNGLLKARHIRGGGIVEAQQLEAESVNVRVGFIHDLDVRNGLFEKLYGTNCRAAGTLAVRDFIQALDVRAKRLVIGRSNIGNCMAEEIVSRSSPLGTAFSSLIRQLCAPMRRLYKAGNKRKRKGKATPVPSAPEQRELQFDGETIAAVLDALEKKGYTVVRPACSDGPVQEAA